MPWVQPPPCSMIHYTMFAEESKRRIPNLTSESVVSISDHGSRPSKSVEFKFSRLLRTIHVTYVDSFAFIRAEE